MNIYYSDMALPKMLGKSIFLAGPTPRDDSTKSWRVEAVDILEEMGYDGTVCIPERSTGWAGVDYCEQVEWEHEALSKCDSIMFWIPRNIDGGMPGFTTNIEFGIHFDSIKTFYGRPILADKTRYLDHIYMKVHPDRKIWTDLRGVLGAAADYSSKVESDRRTAMRVHCCNRMVYATENGVISYETSGYDFTYEIINADTGYKLRCCPWCGTNLAGHKKGMVDGDCVEYSEISRFPSRLMRKI